MNSLFQQISETIGVLDTSVDKDTQLLMWANRGARYLYDNYDLPGTVKEQFFCVDWTQYVVTLPWYVGAVRGLRYSQSSQRINQIDMRPRYNTSPWVQPLFTFRTLNTTPLESSLTQSGTLTFTIAEAQTAPFTVTIIGQTATASRVIESLTFNVGDVQKTSVNQWSQEAPFGLIALKKTVYTTSDIIVTQTATGVQVATIPNGQYEAINTRIQINDWNVTPYGWTSDDCIEVLYKQRFQPFFSLDDSWIDERLEQALVYIVKFLWASETGKDATGWLALANATCKMACNNITDGQDLRIVAEADPLQAASTNFPAYSNYTYGRF
jgi:hypothetical protein